MATIAEQLLASALESSQKAPDLGAAVTRGAELAQTMENIQAQRARFEEQKANVEQQKLENMTSDILKARNLRGKALSGYKEFLKNKARVLKLDSVYTPEAIDLVTSVPENIDRYELLVSQVQSGQKSFQQAAQTLQEQGLYYELDPVEIKRLQEAEKFSLEQQGKTERTVYTAQAALGKQMQAQEQVGNVELRKETSKAFSEYTNEGGKATIEFNFNKLAEAQKELESGKIKTGKGLVQFIGGSDWAVDLTNPEIAKVRDSIRSAIVGTLRPILGGAFAEKEGQRILDLSFNPRLSAKENAKRVSAEISRIKNLVKTKEDQFIKQGRMSPEDRSRLNPGKALLSDAQKKALKELSPKGLDTTLKRIAERTGSTVDELKKELGE